MGVPKFYRWLSERYPKINQVITDSALLPEFDHLYLDMNGIIHGCTHPSHLDVIENALSEKDMMLGIMHYIDRIITQIVKPKVSVFMAIDGVAPRAKLNQQRSRRFRSAKDMADALKSKSKNKVWEDGEEKEVGSYGSSGFDSNCITPGTEFMTRVSAAIQYFIRKKVKEDPLWRNLKIIFSGPEIPGEGEHKIMDFIREMKSQPGYQPNTRHCMYGQDADLIMLGLVSHEPHLTLLREIVEFNVGQFQGNNALKAVKKFTKESDFQLLHLSILREYLEIEFASGMDKGSYNMEAIVDDFVFMTFLVGNDFLPHLPALDIGDNAFDLLFGIYKDQRTSWGEKQYLTNCGEISDPSRLETFLAAVGESENEILEMKETNDAEYLKKRRRWDKRDGKPQGPSDKQIAAEEREKQGDYMAMVEKLMTQREKGEIEFVDGWEPAAAKNGSSKDFKGRYYYEKLSFTPADVKAHYALRKAYIEGLLWCLAYYYKGCISWGWFYPYHYGPMLSDLRQLPSMFDEIKFDIGAPLKPFEQLMGCLPPQSSALVPKCYRVLMCSPTSPIIDFYPTDFQIDMNGKRNPWEAVNLLPFIDVDLLKSTVSSLCPDRMLTADERSRNIVGKVLLYTHDLTATETVPSFNRDIGIPDIHQCNSRVQCIDEPGSRGGLCFKPELVPGTVIPFPGFPSLNVLPFQYTELIGIGLNCFGSPSKYNTTVLTLHKLPQLPGAVELADKLLGQSLFINWPMMHEAKVVGVSDSTCEVRTHKKEKKIKKYSLEESEKWIELSQVTTQQYLNGMGVPGSGGVNIGDIQIRLKLVPLQGMKTSPVDGSTRKWFGKEEAEVPLQMALFSAPAPDPRFIERGPLTLKDRFPPTCKVIVTKGKYRGCLGTVLTSDDDKIAVKVKLIPAEPPFGLAIARSVQDTYFSSIDAAKVLRMNPRVFNKVTGSVFVNPGRYDLGLNLKYKNNLCVLGYTRQRDVPDHNNRNGLKKHKDAWKVGDSVLVVGSQRINPETSEDDGESNKVVWEYTAKAIKLVAAYRQKFPQLFAVLDKNPNKYSYECDKTFGINTADLSSMRDWLNNIETAKMPRSPCSTKAMPLSAVAAVQRAADVRTAQLKADTLKEVTIRVPSTALFREGSTAATDVMTPTSNSDRVAPELGDRIANLCANGIPFGSRGTVVSIHDSTSGCVEVVMDEEFIGGSTLQGACSNFRGKLCVWNRLLRISAADSKEMVDQLVSAGAPMNEPVKASLGKHMKEPAKATPGKHMKEPAKATPSKHVLSPTKESAKATPSKHVLSSTKESAKGTPSKHVSSHAKEPVKATPSKQAENGVQRRKSASSTHVGSQNNDKTNNTRDTGNERKSKVPHNASQNNGSADIHSNGKTNHVRPTDSKKGDTKTNIKQNDSPGKSGGKQGVWREANGPRGTDIGFKGSGRGGKSGYQTWRKLMQSSDGPKGMRSVRKDDVKSKILPTGVNASSNASAGLKAILGVKETSSSKVQISPEKTLPASDASAGLKAILGVRESGVPHPIPAPNMQPNQMMPQHVSNHSHLLQPNALLPNLNTAQLPFSPPAVSAPQVEDKNVVSPDHTQRASDALLEIIKKDSRLQPAPLQPQPSPFNFTYVEEGKQQEAPKPAPHPPMMATMNHPSGIANPPPMTPALGMLQGGMYYPMHGGAPVAPCNPTPPVIPREKKKKTEVEPDSTTTSLMVPSVVVAKAKK